MCPALSVKSFVFEHESTGHAILKFIMRDLSLCNRPVNYVKFFMLVQEHTGYAGLKRIKWGPIFVQSHGPFSKVLRV